MINYVYTVRDENYDVCSVFLLPKSQGEREIIEHQNCGMWRENDYTHTVEGPLPYEAAMEAADYYENQRLQHLYNMGVKFGLLTA